MQFVGQLKKIDADVNATDAGDNDQSMSVCLNNFRKKIKKQY